MSRLAPLLPRRKIPPSINHAGIAASARPVSRLTPLLQGRIHRSAPASLSIRHRLEAPHHVSHGSNLRAAQPTHHPDTSASCAKPQCRLATRSSRVRDPGFRTSKIAASRTAESVIRLKSRHIPPDYARGRIARRSAPHRPRSPDSVPLRMTTPSILPGSLLMRSKSPSLPSKPAAPLLRLLLPCLAIAALPAVAPLAAPTSNAPIPQPT